MVCALKRGFSRVVLTDQHESVLLQAKKNVERNAKESKNSCRFHYHKLQWGAHGRKLDLPPAQLILGADVAYYPEAHSELLDTVEVLLRQGDHTVALFCHPER